MSRTASSDSLHLPAEPKPSVQQSEDMSGFLPATPEPPNYGAMEKAAFLPTVPDTASYDGAQHVAFLSCGHHRITAEHPPTQRIPSRSASSRRTTPSNLEAGRHESNGWYVDADHGQHMATLDGMRYFPVDSTANADGGRGNTKAEVRLMYAYMIIVVLVVLLFFSWLDSKAVSEQSKKP